MLLYITYLEEIQAIHLKLFLQILNIITTLYDLNETICKLRSELPEPEILSEQYNNQINGAKSNVDSTTPN